jgi:hypothetical protein
MEPEGAELMMRKKTKLLAHKEEDEDKDSRTRRMKTKTVVWTMVVTYSP